MPYITFSRNFSDRQSAKRLVRENRIKDSVAELRGSKTISKVVAAATAKGFSKVLVVLSIDTKSRTARAREMGIRISMGKKRWEYGRERKLVI